MSCYILKHAVLTGLKQTSDLYFYTLYPHMHFQNTPEIALTCGILLQLFTYFEILQPGGIQPHTRKLGLCNWVKALWHSKST